jgi:hypothetical protein
MVLLAGTVLLGLCGCESIYEQTQAYLGAPHFAATAPASVQILTAEPSQPKERLGEIRLSAEGNPTREELEARLKNAAARMGADAVFVVYDRMHIFPVVYYDWWGPGWVNESGRRVIVAVAIKYK